MPLFSASPFDLQYGLQPSIPGYCFGSYNNIVDNTNAYVTTVATSVDVATVGLKLIDGAIPVAGQLISIQGTTNAAGVYNVVNVPISTVAGFDTNDNSVGTVSFALTSSD